MTSGRSPTRMKIRERNAVVVRRSSGWVTGVSSESKLAGSACRIALLTAERDQAMIAAGMERCAGMDVGKKFIAVCVMSGPAQGKPGSKPQLRNHGGRTETGASVDHRRGDARTGSRRARARTGSRCSMCGKARCGWLWPIRRKGRRARGTRPTTRMPGGGPSVASRDGDGELDSAAPAARAAGPDAAPPPADPDRQRGEKPAGQGGGERPRELGSVLSDVFGYPDHGSGKRFGRARRTPRRSPLSPKPGRRKRFQTGSPHGKSTAGRIITAG